MERELEELRKVLRALVVSSPTQMDVRTLIRDYRDMMGEYLPYTRWGYKDPVQFLRERCSDCFVLNGAHENPVLTLIVTNEIKHIDKMVQKQKMAPKKNFKPKRRSIPETDGKSPKNLMVKSFNNVEKHRVNNQTKSQTLRQIRQDQSHLNSDQQNVTTSWHNKNSVSRNAKCDIKDTVTNNVLSSPVNENTKLHNYKPKVITDSLNNQDGINSKINVAVDDSLLLYKYWKSKKQNVSSSENTQNQIGANSNQNNCKDDNSSKRETSSASSNLTMERELEELRKVLRALVVSSPTQMDVRTLIRDYRDMMGEYLPYTRWGYKDPVQFLRERCSDCFVLNGAPGNPVLTLIVTNEIKHIDEMVQKQKMAPTKKFKPKRRSIPETNVISPESLIVKSFNNVQKHSRNNQTKSQTLRPIRQNQSYLNSDQQNVTTSSHNNNSVSRNANCDLKDTVINKVLSSPVNVNTKLHNYKPKVKTESLNNQDGINSKSNVAVDDSLPLYKYWKSKRQNGSSSENTQNKNGANSHQNIYMDDNSSERETSSGGSSSKGHQFEQLKMEIKDVIDEHPEGIWCTDLIRKYRERYNRELNFARFGYTSILSLAMVLEDHVQVTRLEETGDWLLSGRSTLAQEKCSIPLQIPRRPLQLPRPARPHNTDPEDALPGVEYDADVFPDDCMHFMETIPSLSLEGIETGAMLEVIIGEVYSPSHFWMIRLGDEFNIALENMMDEMTAYYTSREGRERTLALGAVRVGHYCSSVYEGDWHRSIIVKQIDSDTVKVRHVDYGTVEHVSVSGLKPLLRKWGKLPTQAVRAQLAGVRPSAGGRHWPHAASAFFLSTIHDRRLIANVLTRDTQEDILEVILVDTSTEEDIQIGLELIRSGHADRRPDSAIRTSECYLYPRFDVLEAGATPNYAEIHAYLRDGIALQFVEDYRRHVPLKLDPPHASPPPGFGESTTPTSSISPCGLHDDLSAASATCMDNLTSAAYSAQHDNSFCGEYHPPVTCNEKNSTREVMTYNGTAAPRSPAHSTDDTHPGGTSSDQHSSACQPEAELIPRSLLMNRIPMLLNDSECEEAGSPCSENKPIAAINRPRCNLPISGPSTLVQPTSPFLQHSQPLQMPLSPQMPTLPQLPSSPQMRPLPQLPSSPQMRPFPQLPSSPQMRPFPQLPSSPQMRPLPQLPSSPQMRPLPQLPSSPQMRPLPQLPLNPQISPSLPSYVYPHFPQSPSNFSAAIMYPPSISLPQFYPLQPLSSQHYCPPQPLLPQHCPRPPLTREPPPPYNRLDQAADSTPYDYVMLSKYECEFFCALSRRDPKAAQQFMVNAIKRREPVDSRVTLNAEAAEFRSTYSQTEDTADSPLISFDEETTDESSGADTLAPAVRRFLKDLYSGSSGGGSDILPSLNTPGANLM